MSDNRAYVYQVGTSGSSDELDNTDVQTSPSWVLTVIRWKYRDTLRTAGTHLTEVLPPLIISNDCVNLTVDSDKSSLTPSFSAVLKVTDTNYLTAINPGDFVFVNILNWEADADRIKDQVSKNQPINAFKDGFKGFFKVQGVRENILVDPQSGTKTVFCKLNGFAFTEFNNSIYYNPNLLSGGSKKLDQTVFTSDFGATFTNLLSQEQNDGIGPIIKALIETFIGSGPANGYDVDPQFAPSKNTHFFMPAIVGQLLGIPSVNSASQVYNYIFGIQQYNALTNSTPGTGFNPSGLSNKDRVGFKTTATRCQGNGTLKPTYWNQVKAWAIINQYTNAPLNEIYSCFKVDTDGMVRPTIVFRQTPFTTESFESSSPVTRFMTLPRWYVSPALITALDIGKDEAARINFVQCYAQTTYDKGGTSVSFETAAVNYLFDNEDVKRSGLRPYVFSSAFDELPLNSGVSYRSPLWARIVGDCLMGSHLKLNGSITSIGIVEPIAVGENLELNDVVYHLEQVSHVCGITPDGIKTFRTSLALSNGVSVTSSGESSVSSVSADDNDPGNLYAQMANTSAQQEREDDWDFNQILPGVSESQTTEGRTDPDLAPTENYSFPQPNTSIPTGKKLGKK